MNITAIVVSALATFIIGFWFHMPHVGLGTLWMKLANVQPTGNEKMSGMWKQMLANFVMNLITAFVLSGVLLFVFSSSLMGEANWWRGVICASWLWLGFVVTSSSMGVIWMKQSYKLWLFECLAGLVSFGAMGAIIAAWQ